MGELKAHCHHKEHRVSMEASQAITGQTLIRTGAVWQIKKTIDFE